MTVMFSAISSTIAVNSSEFRWGGGTVNFIVGSSQATNRFDGGLVTLQMTPDNLSINSTSSRTFVTVIAMTSTDFVANTAIKNFLLPQCTIRASISSVGSSGAVDAWFL